jgi:hypothetical protein
MKRDPYDGQPYYCTKCGYSFGETVCDFPDICCLESKAAAQTRQLAQLDVFDDFIQKHAAFEQAVKRLMAFCRVIANRGVKI